MPLYISGPMSGMPELNYPAFNAAAEQLRERQYEVINPAEIPSTKPEMTWGDWMRADLVALLNCDTIYMLKGWEDSDGAKLEKHIADALGMAVMYQ